MENPVNKGLADAELLIGAEFGRLAMDLLPEVDVWIEVTLERCRHVLDLGYTAEQDDVYVNDELAALAAIYAMPPGARGWLTSQMGFDETLGEALLPDGWVANLGDRDRDLVKAAALILAELARRRRTARVRGVQ